MKFLKFEHFWEEGGGVCISLIGKKPKKEICYDEKKNEIYYETKFVKSKKGKFVVKLNKMKFVKMKNEYNL